MKSIATKRVKFAVNIFSGLVIIFLPASNAYAQSINQSDIKSIYNDSVWYKPGAGTGIPGSTSCLAGGENDEKMWNYLISKGLTAPQAAGIMGNIKAESGFNPKRVEDGWGFPSEMDSVPPNTGPQGQPGYGLAQWTSPNRKDGLKNLAVSENLQPSDLGLQLNWLWKELTENYKGTYEKIKQSQDIAFVSKVFGEEYEGYGTNTEELRFKYSQDIFTEFSSVSGGDDLACSTSAETIQLDPNFSMLKLTQPLDSPGGSITPKGITLHWWGSGSGGRGISALVSALRGNSSCGPSGCSVQIGITADGKVYQMTKNLTDLTYHAVGANETTFGIEIEGGPSDFGQSGIAKYPKKFEAVVATVKYLIKTYSLPINGPATCGNVSGVHPHKDYNSCPKASQKQDIDDVYFNAVMQQVRGQPSL